MSKTIRIGCASGFWGDSMMAAPQLVKRGAIDYLVFDYLAEITMGILAQHRAKDRSMGYAHDFVTVTMRSILPEVAAKGIKVLSNAGGTNPKACAEAIEKLIADAGLKLKVAHVSGDDFLPRLEELRAAGIREMFTGADLPEAPLSLNAYLGAIPIAEALRAGADIVVTGRGVDSATTLGACLHAFDWRADDYDRLAQGSLAGHLIECGAQATGGLFTDWHLVPDYDDIGYGIIEMSADGAFDVTKPEGTGGLVSFGTVAEQMLYEIGDPQSYMLPDVVCDFSGVEMREVAQDRVRVTGAKGYPPTDTYKASATFQDGHKIAFYLGINGIRAIDKARVTASAVLKRMDRILRETNLGPYTETHVECVGAEDSYGPHARPVNAREAIVKISARHQNPRALQMLVREITSSATSMMPGTGGYAGNPAKVMPLMRHFSLLIPKRMAEVAVHLAGRTMPVAVPVDGGFSAAKIVRPPVPKAPHTDGPLTEVPLLALAYARSGEKGDKANIGVIARRAEYLPWIRRTLTEVAVGAWFAHLAEGPTVRYELPGTHALNFEIDRALQGGGGSNLRNDPQGKAWGQMLLDMPIEVPNGLVK